MLCYMRGPQWLTGMSEEWRFPCTSDIFHSSKKFFSLLWREHTLTPSTHTPSSHTHTHSPKTHPHTPTLSHPYTHVSSHTLLSHTPPHPHTPTPLPLTHPRTPSHAVSSHVPTSFTPPHLRSPTPPKHIHTPLNASMLPHCPPIWAPVPTFAFPPPTLNPTATTFPSI